MNGKMLWFNTEKGHGLIRTEDDERLYVAQSGFSPGEAPAGRCAGLDVVFDRLDSDGDPYAVNVVFPPEAAGRRARPRQGNRARSF